MGRRRARERERRKSTSAVQANGAAAAGAVVEPAAAGAQAEGHADAVNGAVDDRSVEPEMEEVRAIAAEVLRTVGAPRPVLDYRPRFSFDVETAAPAALPLQIDPGEGRRRRRAIAVAVAGVGCLMGGWLVSSLAGTTRRADAARPVVAASLRALAVPARASEATAPETSGLALPPPGGLPAKGILVESLVTQAPATAAPPPPAPAGEARPAPPSKHPARAARAGRRLAMAATGTQPSTRAPAAADSSHAARAPGGAVSANADQAIDALVKVALSNKQPEKESAVHREPPEPKAALGRDAILAGMRPVLGKVKECYGRYQQSGSARVRVEVGGQGEVRRATVGGKFANTDTGICVEKAVKTARFPASSGMSFDYPFSFR